MRLDPSSAHVEDPCVHCNVVEPDTGEAYGRCPPDRLKAEAYLQSSGVGDSACFAPRPSSSSATTCYSITPAKVSYQIDAEDAAWNTDAAFGGGNSPIARPTRATTCEPDRHRAGPA